MIQTDTHTYSERFESIPKFLVGMHHLTLWCFCMFSFALFSCAFPTGVSATLSTLAFLTAIPVFVYRFRSDQWTLFEKTGFLLFIWLLITVLWSDRSSGTNVTALSEYRLFFMIPIIASCLAINARSVRYVLASICMGLLVALIASYLLNAGMLEVSGAQYSLANRIFHGFIMAVFFVICGYFTVQGAWWVRVFAFILMVVIAYNVLNIETGRTGILQIVALSVALPFIFLPLKRAVLFFFASVCLLVLAYHHLDRFESVVDRTLHNAENAVVQNDTRSSAGKRIEFYRGALKIIETAPMFGVGVGDVSTSFANAYKEGRIKVLTDNVHSEYLNMTLAGGVLGLLCFAAFLASLGWSGVRMLRDGFPQGSLLIGLCILVSISALFNSTIKDYGEKHALLVLLTMGAVWLRSLELLAHPVDAQECR